MTACCLGQQNPAQESLCLPEMHSLLTSHYCGYSHPSRDWTKDLDQAYFPTDEHYSLANLIYDSEGKGKTLYLRIIPNGSNLMI